jgi:hypothetical protein
MAKKCDCGLEILEERPLFTSIYECDCGQLWVWGDKGWFKVKMGDDGTLTEPEKCRDCGRNPIALGSDGLCQACEIAHIEDEEFLRVAEAIVLAIQVSQGIGLSGELEWL